MERADRSGTRWRIDRLGWLALLLVTAWLGAWPLRKGFSDFTASLRAAEELLTGETAIYHGDAEHPEAFAYPHVVLLPLMALLQVFSPRAIELAFGASQGLATVLLVRGLLAIFGPIGIWRGACFVLWFGRLFTNNYQNGQFGLWCAVLVVTGVARLLDGRSLAAGASLAGAATLKLTPLLFLPCLPFLRRSGAALAMAAVLVLLVLIVPWPFLGTETHRAVLAEFWQAMIAPLFGATGNAIVWKTHGLSISGTLDHLLMHEPARPGVAAPLHLLDLDPASARIVKLGWSLVLLGLAAFGAWRARQRAERERLLVSCSLIVLLMALFSPQTKPYHFLASILPAFWFCWQGPGRGRCRVLWWLTAACWLIALPLRQRALLGSSLWHAIDELPIGHLGVVGLLAWTATCARLAERAPQASAGP